MQLSQKSESTPDSSNGTPGKIVKGLGLAGAALGVMVGIQNGLAAATETHQRVTIGAIGPEEPKPANLWGAQLGEGKVVTTTDGEKFDDRAAYALRKWEPLHLNVGETYDITSYHIPGTTPNIRSATPVEEEKD